MAATKYYCKKDCYHNLRMFKKGEVYPREDLGAGKVPHHFESVDAMKKREEDAEAAEAEALDSASEDFDPLEG